MMSTGVPLGLSWLATAAGNWLPGVRPLDPFATFNFAVEIEGLLVGGFTECSGLESEIQTEEYREGGVNDFTHQLPGSSAHSNLVLTHGLTAIGTLWDWYHDTTQGIIRRRNITIILLDRQQIPVMWWNVRNALPVRWTGPSLDAARDEMGFESLELVHEGLTKPLLGQAAALAQGAAQMAR
jgi:phage tail-like protein